MSAGLLLTYWTARAAFLSYVAALALRIASREKAIGQTLWTAGCMVFLLHVICAFQFVHHWSHADALAATAGQTAAATGINWGGGLYFNYLFTVLWLGDVAWWWLARRGYESRPRPVTWTVHGFMAFMMFNATVVFGHGAARWTAAGVWVLLACYWLRSRKPRANCPKAHA